VPVVSPISRSRLEFELFVYLGIRVAMLEAR
jgi:hypothetical protein